MSTWEDKLLSEEEMKQLLEKGIDDKLPYRPPVRAEGETFEEFMRKGSEALCRDHPDLVKRLL